MIKLVDKRAYFVVRKPEPDESADDFDTNYYIVYNDRVIIFSGDYKYTAEEVTKIQELLN